VNTAIKRMAKPPSAKGTTQVTVATEYLNYSPVLASFSPFFTQKSPGTPGRRGTSMLPESQRCRRRQATIADPFGPLGPATAPRGGPTDRALGTVDGGAPTSRLHPAGAVT